MKKFKILSAILSMTVLLSVLPLFTGSVSAATPAVSLTCPDGHPGVNFAVVLNISSADAITAISVGNLQWDTNVMSFVKAEWTDMQDSGGGITVKGWDNNLNQGAFAFTNRTDANCGVLKLYFKTPETERTVTTWLSCDVSISYNGTDKLNYTASSDSIVIDPYKLGDANGDGSFNDSDPIYLLYHIHFGEGLYPLMRPCDVNRTGVLDADDAVYMLYATLYPDQYPLGAGQNDGYFGDVSTDNSADGFGDWKPIPRN